MEAKEGSENSPSAELIVPVPSLNNRETPWESIWGKAGILPRTALYFLTFSSDRADLL